MRIQRLAGLGVILVAMMAAMSGRVFCQRKKECGKPPELVFQPHLSAEDVGRIKSSSLTGTVRVIVEEDGSVGAAKVISASPKEGAQVLYDAVMMAQFKERPGCGRVKLDFIFRLGR